MFDFPISTHFDRRIPKQKFYTHLDISGNIKKLFTDEIETIIWKYKLSPDTINISEGTFVKEIQFIEIVLKQQNISKNIIELIDREIPYHIVFVLKYKKLIQLYISYKEISKNRENKFRIDSIYKTDWTNEEDVQLKIEGLTLDKVYENFILQISDGKVQMREGSDLKEAINNAIEIEKLQKEILILQNRIIKEKQFNRQVKLNEEIKKLIKALEELRG